jgi:hypothetical protein
VLQALIIFAQAAAEEEESSKTAFYIAGAVLAVFAVVVAAIGIRSHATFPGSRGTATAVMGLAAVLVATVMATAVITS